MTTREASPNRWNINLNLDRLDILVLGVLSGLFLGAVGASLYFHFRTSLPDLADWLDSVLQNTGTEMFGAVLTFALIEVMLRKRREQDAEERAIEQEKKRLILQLSSPDNAFAVEAARALMARGWGFGEDTTLHGAYLYRANLQGADLIGANLQEASLGEANLQGALLGSANLQGAKLRVANLQRADLLWANLQGASLRRANLQGASLSGADLQGADLGRANLQGADLDRTKFDGETTLPDGSKWMYYTDMANFTDPEDPYFWQGYGLGGEDLRDRGFKRANLQGAKLQRANLQGVNLMMADLLGADMSGANLQETNLKEANLEGTCLRNFLLGDAIFSEKTTLPDGSKWTPNIDLMRFVDREHDDFWRSDDPDSPAYWDRDD